jgi:hypothetical protein
MIPYFINIALPNEENPFCYTKTGIATNIEELTNIFNNELVELMIETSKTKNIKIKSYQQFYDAYFDEFIMDQSPIAMQYFEDNMWKIFCFIDSEIFDLYERKITSN